ncbi:MAG: hypothetical protein K0S07_484 [Chlamydiales bacterium]|jgi:hypothetical protein|nr:hypothetical protein [Chlamydiales bacterium]
MDASIRLDPAEELPAELLLAILGHVNPLDARSCAVVSRTWRGAALLALQWKTNQRVQESFDLLQNMGASANALSRRPLIRPTPLSQIQSEQAINQHLRQVTHLFLQYLRPLPLDTLVAFKKSNPSPLLSSIEALETLNQIVSLDAPIDYEKVAKDLMKGEFFYAALKATDHISNEYRRGYAFFDIEVKWQAKMSALKKAKEYEEFLLQAELFYRQRGGREYCSNFFLELVSMASTLPGEESEKYSQAIRLANLIQDDKLRSESLSYIACKISEVPALRFLAREVASAIPIESLRQENLNRIDFLEWG